MLNVEGRHPSVAHFKTLFEFEHLPFFLQLVSKPFHDQAQQLLDALRDGDELAASLRKLVEAKDCAVRQARFDKDAGNQTLREGIEAWVYHADGQPDGVDHVRPTETPGGSVIPTIGRIVHYTLSEQDADKINARRTADPTTGNRVGPGDVYPMVITRAWGGEPTSAVNGQVLLDGGDVLWVTSVSHGEGERHFVWPSRV